MLRVNRYPICVAEMGRFSKDIQRLLPEPELVELIDYLAFNPTAGDIIPGTNGVRKIRWSMRGRGKRKGARIIYYFRDLNMPLYLIAAYPKNKKIDLSENERAEMGRLINELVCTHSREWGGLGVINMK